MGRAERRVMRTTNNGLLSGSLFIFNNLQHTGSIRFAEVSVFRSAPHSVLSASMTVKVRTFPLGFISVQTPLWNPGRLCTWPPTRPRRSGCSIVNFRSGNVRRTPKTWLPPAPSMPTGYRSFAWTSRRNRVK